MQGKVALTGDSLLRLGPHGRVSDKTVKGMRHWSLRPRLPFPDREMGLASLLRVLQRGEAGTARCTRTPHSSFNSASGRSTADSICLWGEESAEPRQDLGGEKGRAYDGY